MGNGFTGPPAAEFYQQLSGLGDTLQNNEKVAKEKRLREAFSGGLPRAPDGSVDYKQIGDVLSQNGGDINSLLTAAKLGEEQSRSRQELSAGNDFRTTLGRIIGGGAQPAVAPSVQSPPLGARPDAPMAQPGPRMEVMPSPKVWGDKEAEDAGIYEKPAAPATANYYDSLNGKKPASPIMQPSAQPVAPANDYASLDPRSPGYGAQPAPKPSTGFQGIGIQHAPALIDAMANPRLPAGDRDIAKALLTRALDDAKPNEKIRYLQEMKSQSGYPGSILDLEKELRGASKTAVTTNIDNKGETEEAKAAGKAAGERRAAMFGASQNASTGLASLTRIETLLDQVQQGKLEPSRMTVSAWAKSLGVNDDFAKGLGLDPKSVGSAQAVQSLVNELVIGKLGPGGFPSANFSDADRSFLTDIFPKLGNDPRANKILVESARRIHTDNIQRAMDYQTWKEDPANKGKGFEDFELNRAKKVAQMDRFGDLRKQAESILGNPAASGQTTTRQGVKWSVQ